MKYLFDTEWYAYTIAIVDKVTVNVYSFDFYKISRYINAAQQSDS